MTTLGQSHPYFVRCVKPNEKKVCPAVSAFFSLAPWLKVWMGVPRWVRKWPLWLLFSERKCFFSYESKEMKFCAVFRIDLDSISALHFSVVDAFKEKTAFTVYRFFFQLPQSFNPKVVLSQLRYSGMLETVRIRRAGFPVRRTYEDFLFRYFFYRFHTLVIRELNQPRRRPQRRLQKKKKNSTFNDQNNSSARVHDAF